MKLSWVHSISRPVEPSRLESLRAIRAKPSWRHRRMENACLVWSLWFHQVCSLMSVYAGSPQCLCPALSTEVDLSPIGEGDFSHHHPLPSARPSGQIHRGRRFTFGGSSLTIFKGVDPRMVSPESYSGVWSILVHPSPPGCAYLQSTSFIGRIFPNLHMR